MDITAVSLALSPEQDQSLVLTADPGESIISLSGDGVALSATHDVELHDVQLSILNGDAVVDTLIIDGGSFTAQNLTAQSLSVSDDAVVRGTVQVSGVLNVDSSSIGVNADGSTSTISGFSQANLFNGSTAGDLVGAAGKNNEVNLSASNAKSLTDIDTVKLVSKSYVGSIDKSGSISLSDFSRVDSITDSQSIVLNGGSHAESITFADDNFDGMLTATDSIFAGTASGFSSATIRGGSYAALAGASAGAAFDISQGATIGSITNASNVAITGSSVTGSTSMNGILTANITGGTTGSLQGGSVDMVNTQITGDITATGDVMTQEGSVTGNITTDTSIDLDGTRVGGSLSADESITLSDAIVTGSVTTGTLTATTANSSVGDVTADSIVINTLNAGEGVSLASSVIGAGTLNKSGGDTLTLQAGSDLTAGQVNVTGQSTLDATAGVQLGDLHVSSDSTLIVASTGLASMGTVSAEDVIFDAPGAASSSVLVVDVDLATQKSDLLSAKSIDFNGAKVAINGHNLLSESSIVDHNLISLNAHTYTVTDATTGTESVQIKLSKNYIGAAKTENQSAVATALQSLNLNKVEGSELGAVLAALGQTQSEADALIALDSLNGYELANMNRFVVDTASHHLLTLRNTTLVMSESLGMEEGKRSAASLIITGGGSDLNSDGNGSDYSSSSIGFMLVGARKVTDRWTAGYSFAYSSDSADAGSASMDSNTFYLDASMVYHGKRNTQVFTLGAGFYDLSTSRNVHINAPGYSINGQAEGSTNAALINLGYEMDYSFMNRDAAHLVSAVAQLDATFGTIEGFSEKGMGNAGLYVDPDAIVSVTAAAGARYRHNYQMNGQSGFFSAEMLLTANTGNNEASISNRFIGGGPSITQHASDSSNIDLRLNINGLVPIDEDWSVYGSVNAEFRTDQNSVNAAAGVKYSF